MSRALKVCSQSGCPTLVVGGRCEAHAKAADVRRGTRHERGYGTGHTKRFRPGVLKREPICVCVVSGQHGHGARCWRASSVADHWPRDRRELVAQGLDADDPQYGRGLCKQCHDAHTASAQPGGWNR
jgi:5-methylcytosine-specific restriction protein A